jgi:predicted RNase H-like HicB family nuclease
MKRHHADLLPEEIAVAVRAAFRVRFEYDGERGGYIVRCNGLPEVAAHGATLTAARADARKKIASAVEQRAQAGEPIPRLTYVAPSLWRRWRPPGQD